MPAEADKFVIAMQAMWAEDFEYAERLLNDFSSPWRTEQFDAGAQQPVDFLRAAGALRVRQLWQRRGEFRRLSSEYASGEPLTDQPVILETTHIRATLWRTTEREFVMQGYLTVLDWASQLFLRAHDQSSGAQPAASTDRVGPTDSDQTVSGTKPYSPLGVSWVVDGNPFLQVELTDLGLLEVTGLWTQAALPSDAGEITSAFRKVLNALDEQDTQPAT